MKSYHNTLPTIFFALLFSSTGLHATDSYLVGRVTDTRGNPIPYVDVYSPDYEFGTTTDRDGRFMVRHVTEGTELVLHHSSFESERIEVKGGQIEPLTIVLKPKVYHFDPLVVEGNLYARETLKLPVSHRAVQIDGSTNWGNSVAERLDRKGVQIKDYGGPAGLKTAGSATGYAEHILVMVDNVPLNSPQNGVVDLGFLPADLFSQGEFYLGHGSSLYGSNAVGGVLNLMTERHEPSYLRIRSGGFGERGVTGKALTTVGAGHVSVYGTRYENGGEFRENNDFAQKTFGGTAFYPVTQLWNASLFTLRSAINRGIAGSLTFPSPSARKDNSDNITVASVRGLSPLGQSAISLGVTQFREHFTDPEFFVDSRHLVNGQRVRVIQRFPYTGFIQNTIILEVVKDKVDSDDAGKHEKFTGAAGFLGQLHWGHSLYLYPSVRADWNQGESNPVTTGSLALLWSPNSPYLSSVSLNGGTSYRNPTFNDLFWEDPWGYSSGNSELKSERGRSVEIAGRFNPVRSTFFSIKVRGYHFFNENLIQWIPDDNWVYTPQNLSKTESFGASASLSVAPKGVPVIVELGSEWNRSRVLSRGDDHDKRLLYVPPLFHWGEISWNFKPFSANLSYRYLGRRRYSYAGGAYLDSYQRIDCALRFRGPQFLGVQGVIDAGVRNLENRKNQQSVFDYPEPGRAVYVRLTFEFR